MSSKIQITHKGQDYYKIEIDGEELEISYSVGEAIKKLIAVSIKLAEDNVLS